MRAGKSGGKKRAANMSAEQRRIEASKAALGRWPQYATERDLALIRAAAAARNQGVSKFAVEAIVEKARAVLNGLK